MSPITLFDLCPSPDSPGSSISENMWKVKYCLNFKNLPHLSEFIEAPDIENFYKAHDIAATSVNEDGSPIYTVPVIYDPFTNKYVSDSFKIAEYLDDTYPETPCIFPHGTRGLQSPLEGVFKGYYSPAFKLLWRETIGMLSPVSAQFLLAKYGPGLEAGEQKSRGELLAELKDGMTKTWEWYERTEGPFLMGNIPSWGDFMIASYLVWLKVVVGDDGAEFREVISWNNGTWIKLLNSLQQWEKLY